jgi:hypothetical protein
MPSGWTRWLFEQYKFPFEVTYPQALDSVDLSAKYNVIVLPPNTYSGGGRGGGGRGGGQPKPESIPEKYRNMLGNLTATTSAPRLRRFLETGGTVIAIGSSTRIAADLGVPIADHMVEHAAGSEKSLPREKFYIPGSLLRASVNTKVAATRGLPSQVDVYFDNSPVFRLPPDAANLGITPLAWFSEAAPLRSGWGWGQHYLRDGVIAAEVRIGKGRLYLFGTEMSFRAQPHGTFKFLFNAIYSGLEGE